MKTIREIGRGGFGVVEEVEDNAGGRFARKTFRPASHIDKADHGKLRVRFKREVLTQAKLGGNEIMPVLDSDLTGTEPWFLMPLAEKTYEQQIREDKASGSVNVDAIADILNGLERLHELGYVHRDLNPKNILFHDGNWKLSDLGAVLPPPGNTVTLTEQTVIYTEQYCSPEQRYNFHMAQAPADIFAFGCILHDIFGSGARIPFQRQSVSEKIGVLIEKCTHVDPKKRPTVDRLRGPLLDMLVEMGGHCRVADKKSEEWLQRLEEIESWDDAEFGDFARFFDQLNFEERIAGHENTWVSAVSTPFLTRLPADALVKILSLGTGVSDAIIEKYCYWAGSTAFAFHFADTVCSRLTAIFDNGASAHKALAFIALLRLGKTHHRFYVMRQMLNRCAQTLPKEVAERLCIEVEVEGLETDFRRCAETVSWSSDSLAPGFREYM